MYAFFKITMYFPVLSPKWYFSKYFFYDINYICRHVTPNFRKRNVFLSRTEFTSVVDSTQNSNSQNQTIYLN